jgi:4-amino-4-deoxy-L-arabinose transferase-like glycosyltransferase
MCDTLMVALRVVATTLWIDGLERKKPACLLASAFLIAAAGLTKYFGAALIPGLLVYSLARRRRFENWAWYLLIPVLALVGYEFWTKALYGHGMLTEAAHFARHARRDVRTSSLTKALVDLSFLGGCTFCADPGSPSMVPKAASRRWGT